MNCFSMEYRRHLLQCPEFKSDYELEFVTTYTRTPDANFLTKIKNADLVITQNVKNIPEYTPEYINKNLKPGATLIVTEFWRFNGYWPYSSENARVSNAFWYPVDEFKSGLSFEQYKSQPLNSSVIQQCFDQGVTKLASIDEMSDVRVLDYFLDNHKNIRLFSDDWHPTTPVFAFVVDKILKGLGYDYEIKPMRLNGVNSNRYRIIIDNVKAELGLSFEDENVVFFNKEISVQDYYNFALTHQNEVLNSNMAMPDLRELFLSKFE